MDRVLSLTNRQKAFLGIIVTSLIGGAVSTAVKIGVIQIPPFSYVFLRFAIACLIILPFLARRQIDFIRTFRDLLPVSVFGSLNILLFALGVKLTSATISQLLYAAVPLLVGLMVHFFTREKLKFREIVGLLLGLLGVVVVITLPILEKGTLIAGNIWGNIIIMIAVVCWSLYTYRSSRIQKRYSPLVISSIFFFTTLLLSTPLAIIDFISNPRWLLNVPLTGLYSLVYVSLVSTVISYYISQYAIKHGGAVFSTISLYIVPVVAYFSASIVLGEQFTFGILIGGILALSGIFLVTKK